MAQTPTRAPRRKVIIDREGNLQRPAPQGRAAPDYGEPLAETGFSGYDLYDEPENYSSRGQRQRPHREASSTRPWHQRMLIALAEKAGYAAAWPLRLLASLIEQGVNTLGYLLRLMLILMVVPAILMLSFQFAMADNAEERREVASNAMVAVGDTVAGLWRGVKVVFSSATSDEAEAPPSQTKRSGP